LTAENLAYVVVVVMFAVKNLYAFCLCFVDFYTIVFIRTS